MNADPGLIITTLLCDGGVHYALKIYNPEWLREKDLEPKATGLEFLRQL